MTHDADRTLEWPDGSRFRITRSTADTGGELLEMELELPPRGWAPQPHIHPDLTEEYEVLEGSLDVLIGSEWRTLTKGATAAVALGPFPPSESETARCAYVIRIIPLDFEPYIKRLCSAANERKLGDLSSVRALLYIAVLVREFPLHSRAPGRLLNAATPLLAGVGRVLGLRIS